MVAEQKPYPVSSRSGNEAVSFLFVFNKKLSFPEEREGVYFEKGV